MRGERERERRTDDNLFVKWLDFVIAGLLYLRGVFTTRMMNCVGDRGILRCTNNYHICINISNIFIMKRDWIMEIETKYEPLSRWGHTTATIGDRIYMWGGRIDDFSEESKREVCSNFF